MSALTSLQSSAKATPTRAVSPDARNAVQGPRDENTRNVENSAPLTVGFRTSVTPGQTPASTPHATPAFGLSPARESASPPPQQQQFNPFQPLVPYATAAQMAAPPPPPPQA